jgi:hypothetical protein
VLLAGRDVGWIDANAVETIGSINFDQMYETMVGIGVENALEDAGQRWREVNGFGWI